MNEWTEAPAISLGAVDQEAVRLAVPREITVTLTAHGAELRRFTCSPGNESGLVAGHLLTMGFIKRRSGLVRLDVTGGPDRLVDAVLHPPERPVASQPRPQSAVSLAAVGPGVLHRAADITYSWGELYNLTRGAHAAALFDETGTMVEMAEDIGRYNAVDKVVGARLLRRGSVDCLLLVVTCRVSLEMVEKVVRAGIPLVLTKAAPTDRALAAAAELGLTIVHRDAQRRLYAFAR